MQGLIALILIIILKFIIDFSIETEKQNKLIEIQTEYLREILKTSVKIQRLKEKENESKT